MQIIVKGIPVGKGRPRFSTRGSFVQAYTPKKTKDYEDLIRKTFTDSGLMPFAANVPLSINVLAVMPIPKSTNKKNRQAMLDLEIMHMSKPDVDNILKCILDALNGYAYPDDKQIVDAGITKQYGEEPKVIVELHKYEWDGGRE